MKEIKPIKPEYRRGNFVVSECEVTENIQKDGYTYYIARVKIANNKNWWTRNFATRVYSLNDKFLYAIDSLINNYKKYESIEHLKEELHIAILKKLKFLNTSTETAIVKTKVMKCSNLK